MISWCVFIQSSQIWYNDTLVWQFSTLSCSALPSSSRSVHTLFIKHQHSEALRQTRCNDQQSCSLWLSVADLQLQAMVNELRAMAGFMAMGNGEVLSAFIEAPANKGNTAAWSLVAVSHPPAQINGVCKPRCG